MSPGKINGPHELVITHLKDFDSLLDFTCGIPEMDAFIRSRFKDSVYNQFCVPYAVWFEGTMIALFALNYDAVVLPDDYKDDLQIGATAFGLPSVSESYEETFWAKWHYPAIEISYLAVQKDFQHLKVGTQLIEEIVSIAKRQALAGCQFVTVEAYRKAGYSAEGFYWKCRFSRCSDPDPVGDTVRMYRFLF